MSLFSSLELNNQSQNTQNFDTFSIALNADFSADDNTLASKIHELPINGLLQFWSRKSSNLKILKAVINAFGAVSIYFTTWGLSEIAVRQLATLHSQNLILSVSALLDERILIRRPSVAQLAKSLSGNIGLSNAHAKVMVIQNQKINISIVSSANLTKNPRLESSVIINSQSLADFNKQIILREIQNATRKL